MGPVPLPKTNALTKTEAVIDYDLSGLKVLVADDNSVNRFIAKRMLSNMGVTDIITAENGLEAIEKMKQSAPDVILMDGQMPELDGYEAAIKIREYEADQGQKHRIYIIAYTGNASEADKVHSFSCGMDDHLAKPAMLPDLKRAIAMSTPRA